jgi:putative redox protein
MHAPLDEVVAVDDARRLYEAARHPKSFVSLDGADHRLTGEGDARYAAELIATWAARYLSVPLGEPLPEPGRGEVIVEGGEAGYANRVRTPDHQLLSDEPRHVAGGTGTGPNPYDLLLAGLGSCTSMTLKMYADRKGWPLERVRVRLSHQKIHAADCADCETENGKIDEIQREITVWGDLDEAQRARLLEIADRCPVHRTLSGEIKIRSRLAAP